MVADDPAHAFPGIGITPPAAKAPNEDPGTRAPGNGGEVAQTGAWAGISPARVLQVDKISGFVMLSFWKCCQKHGDPGKHGVPQPESGSRALKKGRSSITLDRRGDKAPPWHPKKRINNLNPLR
jgi:hypothetical protein